MSDATPSSKRSSKPRIAVFSGAVATIANSAPLVTSNQARAKHGLPPRANPDGSPMRWDALRPQRLARPVTVYIEQFSAHPLERDAAELYTLPDGYVDSHGAFHKTRQNASDVAVYEAILRPEDGLFMLPYMARQADERAWEDDGTDPFVPAERCRQPFYPDASRIFEEIDRFTVGFAGVGNLLSSLADFSFYRAAPPGGYKKGLPHEDRTDVGDGDIAPETLGEDFFPYRPLWLFKQPPLAMLARVTNMVRRALGGGEFAGLIWLEGSPNVEETIYWLNLLIDTTVPMVGNASQHPHGGAGNDGDQNIVDSVDYIVSRVWADESGRDKVGAVAIQNKQIFAAREVQKGDARPGGYVATGGHGGILGRISDPMPPTPTVLTFVPTRRHTSNSAVNFSQLPDVVSGVRRDGARIVPVPVRIKDAEGNLPPTAIPRVTIVKESYQYAGNPASDDPIGEADIIARIEDNLRRAPLAGFVGEGLAPYGIMVVAVDATLRKAVFSGMPVVKVGRGNAEGFASRIPPFLSGSNLTATKARLLLMACLMKFGSLPVAADPGNPTHADFAATLDKLKEYQAVFDTH